MVRILRPHTQPPSSVSTLTSSSPTSSPSKRILPINDSIDSIIGDGGGKCPVIIVHDNDNDHDEEEGTKIKMRGTNRTDDTTTASSPLKENGGNNVVHKDGTKPPGKELVGTTSNDTRLQPTSPSPVLPNLSMQSMITTAPATTNISSSIGSATTITIISAPITRRKSCQELLLLQPTKSCFRTSMGKLGSKSSNCLESMDGIILKGGGGNDDNNNNDSFDGYAGDMDRAGAPSSFKAISSNHTKARRNVSFHQIEIAEHAYELGDNPSVADGCPLQLGWDVQRTVRMNVDEYEGGAMYGGMGEADENDENEEVGISSPRRRRTRQELRLSSEYRKEAALQAGWTTTEVAVAALRARHEAWRRRRSIQQHFEGWDGWHYRLEKATRTIKKVASMPTIFIGSTPTTSTTTTANRKKKKGHTSASMSEQEQAQPTTRRRRSLNLRGRRQERMEEQVHCDDNPRAEISRKTESTTSCRETLGKLGCSECATTIQQHIGVSYEDDDVDEEEKQEQERKPSTCLDSHDGDNDGTVNSAAPHRHCLLVRTGEGTGEGSVEISPTSGDDSTPTLSNCSHDDDPKYERRQDGSSSEGPPAIFFGGNGGDDDEAPSF